MIFVLVTSMAVIVVLLTLVWGWEALMLWMGCAVVAGLGLVALAWWDSKRWK